MPEKKPLSVFTVIVIAVAAAVVIAVPFGFLAGFVAGNQQWNSALLAVLPPSVTRFLAPPAGPAVQEQYSMPQIHDKLNQIGQEQAVIDAVKKASPAVVSIVISKNVPVWEQYYANPQDNSGDNGGDNSGDNSSNGNDYFQQFFNNFPGFNLQQPQYRQNGTQKQEIGAGSGFFASPDGYIITNRHVVEDTGADYTVITSDGQKLPGKVIGRDTINDIAVIKVDKTGGKDFPYVALGDSDKIQVGQSVLAIGYALGQFGNSVSAGIVSGLQRSIQAGDGAGMSESLYDVIQTDAAINPGNSGGPLLNLKGEAVGVNVAIVEGSQSIGFALPINDVKKVYESLKTTGKVVHPFLGVRYVPVTKDLKDANQLSVDYGALIVRGDKNTDLAVMPGSPADLAGIVENDIILEVDGQKITEANPLQMVIDKHSVGDEIQVKILHKGKEKDVTVKLTERKQ